MRVRKRKRPSSDENGVGKGEIGSKAGKKEASSKSKPDGAVILLSKANLNPEVLIGYNVEWDGGSGEVLGLKDGTTPVKYRVFSGGSVKLFDVRKKKKVKVIGRGAIWKKEKSKEIVPSQPGDMKRARKQAKVNAAKNREEAEKGPGTGSIDAIFDTLPDKMKAKKERMREQQRLEKEEEEQEAQIEEEEAMYLGRDVADGAGRSSDGMGGWKWDGNEGKQMPIVFVYYMLWPESGSLHSCEQDLMEPSLIWHLRDTRLMACLCTRCMQSIF
jgi:hypothetical protein